uniref:Uncharacterized protein n=1 Tax=Bellilinea caldifistulae TaxID=360411 RepID=A0A7C4L1Y0_9CHLR
MTTITLWEPEERPAYILYYGDVEVVGPTLAADEVVCDMCLSDLPLRPVPVVDGDALCLECLTKVVPDWQSQVTPLLELIWRTQISEFQASE